MKEMIVFELENKFSVVFNELDSHDINSAFPEEITFLKAKINDHLGK